MRPSAALDEAIFVGVPASSPTPSPSPSASPSPSPTGVTPAPVRHDFVESRADLDNPERGFYVGYNLLSPGSAAGVRSGGHTLAIAEVHLDAYRDSALSANLLTSLGAGFAAARSAGIKLVLRFAYNSSFAADASQARILGHITQLTPLLVANADIIAVMQAGFIGAWGEWHSSTNGLDNDTSRGIILRAILAALPASRGVQIRTPMLKAGIFPGPALGATEAFTGSERARVGHHNDCFLASSSDLGTFASPVATWKGYVAAESLYTPVGGETCGVFPQQTDCAPALATMAEQHWSYLNEQYHQSVLAGWTTQGCMTAIKQRLGYRLVLEHASVTPTVAPGGELTVELALLNRGFAAPFNARPVQLVLSSGTVRLVATLDGVEVRRWAGGERVTLSARLRVPAGLAAGSYELALALPDAAPALRADPRQAIQLANVGTWRAATGDNLLGAVSVDAAAPGPIDREASAFALLP